jgi:hypothetical protein
MIDAKTRVCKKFSKAYPRDFAAMIRYYTDLQEKISEGYPLPASLTLEQLDRFIEERGDRFPIQWLNCNWEPSTIA